MINLEKNQTLLKQTISKLTFLLIYLRGWSKTAIIKNQTYSLKK